MTKYLANCFLAASVTFTLIAAFNWIIDPYWIYNTAEIKNFNADKPAAYTNQRIFEITNILNNPPQALIIGTSREDMGIDPKHSAFHGLSVFNAAISSQPLIESKEILLSLSKKEHFPRLIVFGLLFEKSNIFNILPTDYTKNNFAPLNQYQLLLSSSTIDASIKTIQSNLSGVRTHTHQKNGFRPSIESNDLLKHGQHDAFIKSEKHYLNNQFPLPSCKNTFIADRESDKATTPLQELRSTIAIAYRQKTDMRLFIGPSHARQWETIHANGLWENFEAWKRIVVDMVESEALKAHTTPFQVWDFSGYNMITEENVPAVNDIHTRMRYYYESSHYTPVTGDLVLNRIFNLNSPERTLPNNFGVLLNRHTIEAHLANIRLARENYRQTHPQDVAEIEAMANEITKNKNCPQLK